MIAIKATDPSGQLQKIPENIRESELPPEKRINRATIAQWKYHNGAIGTFNHALTLHGVNYEAFLEVWGDGYSLRLEDPYSLEPRVVVRDSESDTPKTLTFPSEDPYEKEQLVFFSKLGLPVKIPEGCPTQIQSPYADAVRTYELSWLITERSQ